MRLKTGMIAKSKQWALYFNLCAQFMHQTTFKLKSTFLYIPPWDSQRLLIVFEPHCKALETDKNAFIIKLKYLSYP